MSIKFQCFKALIDYKISRYIKKMKNYKAQIKRKNLLVWVHFNHLKKFKA